MNTNKSRYWILCGWWALLVVVGQGEAWAAGIGDAFSPAALSATPLAAPSPLQGATPGAAFTGKPALAPSQPGGKSGTAPGQDQTGKQADPNKREAADKVRLNERPPLVPNSFQLFIQQSTGQVLPIYGMALFEQTNPFAALDSIPVSNDYVVGPGDEIALKVYSATIDLDQRLVVDREGRVTLPKLGPLAVAGIRKADLEPFLKGQLGKVISDFNLAVSMGKLRGIEVYVVGQARSPGKYLVSSVSTLLNALFATGGPNNNGSLRQVQLLRDGKVVSMLDLYGFLLNGDTSRDVRLQQGDVINFQRIGAQVALMGATPNPAIYELSAAEKASRLSDVLPYAGGVPVWTNPTQAILQRVDPTHAHPLSIDSLTLDSKGQATTLRDGDILTLFPIKSAFDNAVTLHIADASPIHVPIKPGARIRDVIPNRDALLTSVYYLRRFNTTQPGAKSTDELARIIRNSDDQIDWGEAIVERVTPEHQHQVLSFNLEQAVVRQDPTQNLALQPGDIITIFSQKDVQVPIQDQTRMVRLEGEVQAPGIYQIQPGESLRQLVARAGGLTERAYVFGTEVARESVKAQQLKNLNMIIRQMETQLTATYNKWDFSASAVAGETTLRQESAQRFQQKIDELKAIQPSGRVVMEMDPYSRTLPDFPLENGDNIKIPYVPSSVIAVGAVYNENSLIYRPKRTVADYLEVAGVTPVAERDNTFVVRADGTVISSGHGNWLTRRSVKDLRLMPGDTIVVPEKYPEETGYSTFMRGLVDWSTALGQIGLAAVAIKVLHP